MIGVFDSGYGGLTILKEITKLLPEYDYMYLGDNARYPYGNRSKETIIRFTDEAVKYLFEQGCHLVILACFTASALALREMQEKHLRNPKSRYKDRKILGVLLPVVEQAVRETKNNRIGVVATRGTVASKSFETEIKKLSPNAQVIQQACPLLVPLVEEHWQDKPEAKMILRKYLRPLKSRDIDTLILGCTHYPLMYKDFRAMMPKKTRVLHPGENVAKSLKVYLERHTEIEIKLTRNGNQTYFTTDDPAKFLEFNKGFLKLPIEKVGKIAFTPLK